MKTTPAFFAFIDKGANGFPIYMKEAQVDHKMIYDYYMKDDPAILNAMKGVFGIQGSSPCFYGVFCDYLIDPRTGEVLRESGGESFDEFIQSVQDRQMALIAEAGMCMVLPV